LRYTSPIGTMWVESSHLYAVLLKCKITDIFKKGNSMGLSEADTKAKIITPQLKTDGWAENYIVREYFFTDGRKLIGNKREKGILWITTAHQLC